MTVRNSFGRLTKNVHIHIKKQHNSFFYLSKVCKFKLIKHGRQCFVSLTQDLQKKVGRPLTDDKSSK